MSKSKQFFIRSKDDLKVRFNAAYQAAHDALAGGNVVLTLSRETRSNVQNAKMWAMLSDLSSQKEWDGCVLSVDSWKSFCMQACDSVYWGGKGRMVRTYDKRGFIFLGYSTSNLSKKRFSELIETIYGVGLDLGVVFSDESIKVYNENKIIEV